MPTRPPRSTVPTSGIGSFSLPSNPSSQQRVTTMSIPDKIAQLLNGTYEDPDGLGLQRVATQALVIAPTLDGMERDLIKSLDFEPNIAVVSDKTTHAVLGKR